MYSDVLLQFLEDENFAWCFRKSANADFLELVILEEGLRPEQLPSHAVMHLLDDIVVPVLTHVGEPRRKYNIASLLACQKHLLKQQIVHVVVVDQSSTCHKVKLILIFLRELFWVAKRMFVQFSIDSLDGGVLKHIRTDITTINLFESLFAQVFTDQTSATCHIKNFDISRVFFVLFGEFLNKTRHVLGIGITHP